jgi:peptidyl-prolyl cis-trans isomerase SurA
MMMSRVPAQTIDAAVEGEPITVYDVEQRVKFMQLTHKTISPQEVVEELRSEKLRLRTAGEAGLEVTDSEVARAYAIMAARMRLTSEQLTATLAREGVGSDTLKNRIRADLAWQKYTRSSGSPPPARDNSSPWRE